LRVSREWANVMHLCCYAKLIVTLKPFQTHPIGCRAGVAKLGQRRRAREGARMLQEPIL
jgi:hypothetical protein